MNTLFVACNSAAELQLEAVLGRIRQICPKANVVQAGRISFREEGNKPVNNKVIVVRDPEWTEEARDRLRHLVKTLQSQLGSSWIVHPVLSFPHEA